MRSSPSTGRRLPLAALGGILALTASVTASPAAADHTSFPTRVTLMGAPARSVDPGLLELPAQGPAAHVYPLR